MVTSLYNIHDDVPSTCQINISQLLRKHADKKKKRKKKPENMSININDLIGQLFVVTKK